MKEAAPKPPCWALKSNHRPFFEIFVELPTRQPSPSGVTGLFRMAPPMSGSCESSRAISAAGEVGVAHSAPRRWWTTVAIRARGNVANDRFDQRLPQSFIGEQPVRQGGEPPWRGDRRRAG